MICRKRGPHNERSRSMRCRRCARPATHVAARDKRRTNRWPYDLDYLCALHAATRARRSRSPMLTLNELDQKQFELSNAMQAFAAQCDFTGAPLHYRDEYEPFMYAKAAELGISWLFVATDRGAR